MAEQPEWTRRQLEEMKRRLIARYNNGMMPAVEYHKDLRALEKLIERAKD